MAYRGFEIKPETRVLRYGTKVTGFSIYQNGQRLLMAADRELAKKVIDARLASGLWKVDSKEAILQQKEDQNAQN